MAASVGPTAENLRYGDAVKTPKNRADTRYGFEIYPWWNNLNDRVAYMREFSVGTGESMRIAQAMISQDPTTPDAEIRSNMIVHRVPPRTGYRDTELTITDVLNQDFNADSHINDSAWNDFSGEQGETNATQRPYMAIW